MGLPRLLFSSQIITLLCLAVAEAALEIPAQVRRPPTITKQSDEIVYAIPKIGIRLDCAADAVPGVKASEGYFWKKDGRMLQVAKYQDANVTSRAIIMAKEDGSISFNGSNNLQPSGLMQYEGRYQCFAKNRWGTAISQIITLKAGTMVDYVTPENKVYQANEGESAEVRCRQSTENDTETRWELDPEDKLPSERIAQALDGTLIFSNVVAEEDQDLQFYCTVKSLTTRSSIDGTHYTLDVNTDKPAEKREPIIVRPKTDNEERIALRGDELKLICISVGFPTPTVYWEKDGENLAVGEDDRYEIRDFNRTLYIREVRSDDEGEYRCMAFNELGATRRSVNIVVQAKPYFRSEDERPNDVIKVPGESAVIKCIPSGIPPPEVEWMINGVPITELEDSPKRAITKDRIVVGDLDDSDTAVYQCVGKNKHGVVMGQGFLNVMTSPPIAYADNPTFYRVMKEGAIEMRCKMFGAPPPEVLMWTKLDDPERVLIDDERITQKDDGTLKIGKDLSLADSGTYTCTATNEYGSASINVSLLVLSKTVVRPIKEDGIYYAEKGGSIKMAVEIDHHPNLTWTSISWHKDGTVFGNHLELTLYDVKMQEGGKYRVLVKTELDQAMTNVELIVQDVPEAPGDPYFKISESDNYTGILNWEVPYLDNNAAIEGYMIEYEVAKIQPDVWKSIVEYVPGSQTWSRIANLDAWLSYRFRVWARNKIGWSKVPSVPTEPHETPPKAPSINPTGVSGKGTAPDNMVISWDPVNPMKFAGPGFGYEVSWCVEADCKWTVELIENGTSFTVDGRSPYTRHLINITSANDKGRAPTPESVVGYSGEDVPLGSPEISDHEVGEDSKVVLTWDPVPEEKMRGLVTGYQVVATNQDDGTDKEVFVGPNERRVTMELDPYTNYEIAVTATNSAGASDPSQVVSVRTPEGVPETPTKFRVSRKSLKGLKLKWEEPEKKNGIITSYSVEYAWSDNGGVKKNSSETTETEMEIFNLKPDTTYYIKVCAATKKGYGSDCAQVSSETISPKAPREPEYDVSPGDVLANISWTPSQEDEEDGVPSTSFYVQHRPADEENKEWKDSMLIVAESDKSNYDMTIAELVPGSRYEFRIVAINDFGNTTTNSSVVLTSGASKIATGIVGQIWFIILLCIIALIILILVIVCFARRRKGGKYSVSEKEEQLVKLESQPMNNDEAGKYSVNPSEDAATGENGGPGVVNDPLQSRRTRGDSVGGNSIEAFGSGDTRGFEEDGSFIDQYGVDRRSHGKSEGVGSPVSDQAKEVTDAESKLLPET